MRAAVLQRYRNGKAAQRGRSDSVPLATSAATLGRPWRPTFPGRFIRRRSSAHRAGVILAYSNSLAGRFADVTVQKGMGNVGCFYGGAAACALSMLALLLFSTFGSLGREDLLPQKTAKAA